MDEQSFKFNYVFQGQPYQRESIKLLSRIIFTSVVQQSLLENGGDNIS